MKNVNLVLALHMHQPVGNFPEVVDRITKEVYRPVLEVLEKHPGVAVNLHVSGPLLEVWSERHGDLIKKLKDLVATGRVEMLSGGFYEPVLVEWAEEDRDGQLGKMNQWLKERLGAAPAGVWLAEGVWGPSLCGAFGRAGLKYTLVDGSFFQQGGIIPAKMNGHYVTDQAGNLLSVLPTCPDLARLIPHAPLDELFGHLRRIANRAEDITLSVAANLENWSQVPGGVAGYLEKLFLKLGESSNWVNTLTGQAQLLRQSARGRVSLPPGTPAELGGWSLPGAARKEFFRERGQLAQRFDAAKWLPFFRGGSWASFRVRYEELNLLYRKNLLLARRLRGKNQFPGARGVTERLWRSQCSTAQWHGTQGGLHLPHLRGAIWRELLMAEAEMRAGQTEMEVVREDVNADGQIEVVAGHPDLTMLFAPHLGGACLEVGLPGFGRNLADVLTRRDEGMNGASAAPTDWYERRMFQDHFFAKGTTVDQLSAGTYPELGDFILQPFEITQMRQTGSRVTLSMQRDGGLYRVGTRLPCLVEKTYAIDAAESLVEVSYRITNTGRLPLEAVFATELNLNVGPDQSGRGVWQFGESKKSDRDRWQGDGVTRVVAGAPDGLEVTMSPENLPWVVGYPLLDAEKGPEGPIRQGNCVLFGQHLDLKPGEKAEGRLKVTFRKKEPKIAPKK
jgi:alpha-amylase